MKQASSRFSLYLIAGIVAWTGFATQSASAGWSVFFVTDGAGNKVAEVAEQIFPATFAGLPAAYGLDYQFRVLNISPAPGRLPIDGFEVFTGNQAGLGLQVSFLNPPHFPSGYGAQFGPVGNAIVPFLTAEGNTFSPVPWQFSESDQRPGALTGYRVAWTTGVQPLPFNRWTQFDLFSTLGPVPGSGAVDPFSGGGLIIDLTDGSSATLTFPSGVLAGTTMDTTDPNADFTSGGPYDPNGPSGGTFANAPEPGSVVMFVTGTMGLISCANVRRARRKTVLAC
jgi:hypothetical protein